MNLFDFLRNRKNEDLPQVQPIQLGENGDIDYNQTLKLQNQQQPLTLAERLTGRTLNADEDKPVINSDGSTQLETIKHADFRPGFLNDFSSGYNENRNNPISLDNFGQKKNIATRLGEGAGTLARFMESPMGRGLLVAGVVGASGGGALPALTYGSMAGVGNQGYRTADKLYRDMLTQQGVNTSNIRGYVTDDMFKQAVTAKQLQDNAEYRKEQRIFNQQMKRAELADKQAQRAFTASENAKNRAVTMRGQDINAQKNNGEDFQDVENQLKSFESSFKTVNNPYRYRIAGGASNFLNTLTPEESNFNAQRTLLFNQIARKLGGEKGVLSDQDIRRIEGALPSLSDTYEQKQAKMNAVYNLLNIKKGGMNISQGKADPLGIR